MQVCNRQLVGWAATAAAVCALSACSADASSEPGTSPVTRGPTTGDLFLVGTVSAGGEPRGDAKVWLSHMPENDDTPIGGTVDTWESEPILTDADGTFSINVDPDQVPGKYWPESGEYLNFDLQVVADDELATWASTLWLLPDAQVWRTQQARPGDQVMSVSLDLEQETIEDTDSEGATESNELAVMPVPAPLADG